MKKLVRDGLVGLLISPGYGAGWSTWADEEMRSFLLFDSELLEAFEQGTHITFLGKKFPESRFIGTEDLVLKWIPEGTKFYIEEYDGYETVVTEEDIKWLTA